MLYVKICLLIFCLVQSTSGVQIVENNYPTGLIEEDLTYNQLPRQAYFDGAKFDELPLSIDLSPYCPNPGYQGEIQSCVGWAIGYGAMTIQRAIQQNWNNPTQITQQANSAMFIFNQVKEENCMGAKFSDAIPFAIQHGDCLAKDFDTDINDCEKMPDSGLQKEALQYTIKDFMALFSSDADPEVKVLKIKKALARKNPVIVGINIKTGFHKLKNAQYWWPDNGDQTPAGGHALVVVGYDERKGAFRLMNSWGKEWGDKGFIWIKFHHFGKICRYAYTMLLNEVDTKGKTKLAKKSSPQKKIAPTLSGSLDFKYFDRSMRNPDFKSAKVLLNENHYELKRKDWKVGDLFQVLAKTQVRDEYLYVFSIDSKDKATIHFPRPNNESKTIDSPLIVHENSELTIPSEDRAMVMSETGTEYLCALFSTKKIENIQAITEQLIADKESLQSALNQILKDDIIPLEYINYASDEIRFQVASKQEGIVPLVLIVRRE